MEKPMTIRPETEALIQQHLQSGQFQDVDELLTKALEALQAPAVSPGAPKSTRPPGQKSLVELFEESPWKGLDLDFSRNRSTGRPVDL
jgi:hypothetical protein